MKRRTFMGLATAGMALSSWAIWKSPQVDPDVSLLEFFLRRARAAGKPLLVFIAPDGGHDMTGLGWLLQNGNQELYLDLALFEVACLTAKEADVPTGETAPFAKIFDSEQPGSLCEVRGLPSRSFTDQLEFEREDRTLLADRLRASLLPDTAHLHAYARMARKALGSESEERSIRWRELSSQWSAEEVLSIAALLRIRPSEEDTHGVLRNRLVSASRRRIWNPPALTRFVRTIGGGCGGPYIEIWPLGSDAPEDTVTMGLSILCGMGHIPLPSRQFLSYYTE